VLPEPGAPSLRSNGSSVVPALWAGAGALLLALAGMLATDLGPWYQALRQPAWKPSDLWFGPVWSTLYTLAATAAVLVWRRSPARSDRRRFLAAWVLNGSLNVLWSALFFRARRPDWALAEVLLLALSIVLLMVLAGRASGMAVWLLLPYLLWVGFAAVLNLAVVQLNAPFGAV
jgi:tryptophan-rich sensory protein